LVLSHPYFAPSYTDESLWPLFVLILVGCRDLSIAQEDRQCEASDQTAAVDAAGWAPMALGRTSLKKKVASCLAVAVPKPLFANLRTLSPVNGFSLATVFIAGTARNAR